MIDRWICVFCFAGRRLLFNELGLVFEAQAVGGYRSATSLQRPVCRLPRSWQTVYLVTNGCIL